MTVLRRARTLLKRRGLIGQKDDAAESEPPPAVRDVAPGIFADIDDTGCILPSCAALPRHQVQSSNQLAWASTCLVSLDRVPPSKRKDKGSTPSDETCGFSVDASVRISAGDFEGRERLSETADGRIAYKMKKPRQGKRFLRGTAATPLSLDPDAQLFALLLNCP